VKAVVDTNVIAYYVLGTQPFAEECRTFWRRLGDAVAPASWEGEVANVLWLAVRHGVVSDVAAMARLEAIGRLGIESVGVRSLWRGALARALGTGVAVYDALFVELAARRRLPLATFDDQLLRRFPQVARRPRDLGR
jgi:predicted nucleic acid-binding protein